MDKVIELAREAGFTLGAFIWAATDQDIERFYTLARADYETNLSAVMPAYFKDWHENSRSEWPELAAWVITNLREHRAELEAENEKLREALEETQSLLATILHEPRPADEIEDQIRDNRAALLAARGETK